jgi:ketosteroid isomerase-like protein
MPEGSTTPELVELVRMALEATNLGDLDAAMKFYAPDAVWEVIALGAVFEGAAAIRAFLDDWIGAYDEFAIDIEEILDLGSGVALTVLVQRGRPVDSTAHVHYRLAQVSTWIDGVVVKITGYNDIDEARAAAERLAPQRG